MTNHSFTRGRGRGPRGGYSGGARRGVLGSLELSLQQPCVSRVQPYLPPRDDPGPIAASLSSRGPLCPKEDMQSMEEGIFVTKWELGDAWQVLGPDDKLFSQLTWVPGFLSLRMEMGAPHAGPPGGSAWADPKGNHGLAKHVSQQDASSFWATWGLSVVTETIPLQIYSSVCRHILYSFLPTLGWVEWGYLFVFIFSSRWSLHLRLQCPHPGTPGSL